MEIEVNLTFDQCQPIQKNGKPLTPKQREEKRFYSSNIAGVTFHNTDSNVGPFVGYMEPEPDNIYDSHAVAIYEHTGRLIGYLPKSEHRKYSAWRSNMNKVVVVGFIHNFYLPSENRFGLAGYVEAIKLYTDEEYNLLENLIREHFQQNLEMYKYHQKDTIKYYNKCNPKKEKPVVQDTAAETTESVEEDTIIVDEYEEETNMNSLKWISIAAITIFAIFGMFLHFYH